MDDEKFISQLTPERRLLYSQIEMPTYHEARRLRGPIYDVLATELLEENCPITACQFQKLVIKETELYELEAIRVRVMDRPKLLFEIFELVKHAERSAKLQPCTGYAECFQTLYKTIQIFEPLNEFDWLLFDLHKMYTDLCQKITPKEMSSKEWMARIYYKAAMYFFDKLDELENVRDYLGNAFALVREYHFETGDTEPNAYETLHQTVGKRYSDILLKCAHQIVNNSPLQAIELGHQAVLVLAEIGAESNQMRFCKANLSWAEFYMKNKDYLSALKVLEKIKDVVAAKQDKEYGILCCDLYLTLGTCYTEINNRDKARTILTKALELSILYGSKTHEAEAQLNYARLFVKNIEDRSKAREAFNRAKEIFIELNDMRSIQKVEYLMGEMLATETFPLFMDLLKGPKEKFCNYHQLCQWKLLKKPFWSGIHLKDEKEEKDRLYCLIEEHYGAYTDPKQEGGKRSRRN